MRLSTRLGISRLPALKAVIWKDVTRAQCSHITKTQLSSQQLYQAFHTVHPCMHTLLKCPDANCVHKLCM